MGILQQRRRSDCNGIMDTGDERIEIFMNPEWQPGGNKVVQDFSVTAVRQSNLIQIVLLHELIKDVCTNNYSAWNRNGHPGVFVG